MPRALRMLILLLILFVVGMMTLAERYWVRTWTHPLHVAVYPIALDAESRDYVAKLAGEEFREVGEFLMRESQRRGIKDVPAPRIDLKTPIGDVPPLGRPTSKWEAIKLSLGLRWFAFRHTPFWQGLGTVRFSLLYHHAGPGEVLPHSLGLEKGLLGVVHLFSDARQHAQNNVVMTHELLHALGATDKYDVNGMPTHPWGYADPYAVPLLPQYQAEIMGGRVPISESHAVIPANLAKTVVGAATAVEIGW